jgi:drug/metabolite transporter (DMT)-like permease
VIAILGGLATAVLWASSTLTSSRSGRLIGAASTLAWMMLVGLLVAIPMGVASGPLPTLTPSTTVWMLCSGIGNVVGLLFVYRGLRIGKVGVIAALASTEGAIAAVISVAAGERMTIPVALTLCVIVVGIAVVALASGESAETNSAGTDSSAGAISASADIAAPHRFKPAQRAVLWGVAAALVFGLSIYSTARLGASMSPMMAVLPARVVGVVGVFIPLAIAGRLRLTRPAAPMVLLIGLAEVFGNATFVVGSGQSIAISAVLASQFAAISAVAAFLIFHERLSLPQRYGVISIAIGVAVLTATRA